MHNLIFLSLLYIFMQIINLV